MLDLDEELRVAGARWRAEQSDPVVDVAPATADSRPRRLQVVVGAGIAVAASVVIGVLAFGGPDSREHVIVAPNTTPVTTPRPNAIPLPQFSQPSALAADGDTLWVAYFDAFDTTKLPGRRGNLLQQAVSRHEWHDMLLPDDTPYEIRLHDGFVWVAAQNGEESTELLKFNPRTRRIVARIPGEVSSAFEVGTDAIWAPDGIGNLRRIDPTTARVTATIPVHAVGPYAAMFVTAGPLGVFVGNGYDGTVQRIDETTNTAGPEIDVGDNSGPMIELGDSLWIKNSDGSVLTEWVNGERRGRTIDLGERTTELVTDGTSLWVATEGARVLSIDPTTGAVTRVALPKGTRPLAVAADPETGEVWAATMEPKPQVVRVPTGG